MMERDGIVESLREELSRIDRAIAILAPMEDRGLDEQPSAAD